MNLSTTQVPKARSIVSRLAAGICIQPDGIWYYNVTEANLDRIIEQHLVGGVPVEDLIYHRQAPACASA